MSSIIKTRTQGFRVCTFRNQEVHKYYSHLQSVMRSIDSNGAYNELFAKPEIDSMAVGATEIEWTCSGSGKAVHISQLSESDRNRIEKKVSEAYSKIEAYIAENRSKSGKNRDYAQFLTIVGKRPDTNQIWVVNDKPVIVQWGFSDDNGLMGSSGIYSDWDSFIKDIKREPEKPEEPVKIKEPVEEEKTEKIVETVAPAASASLFAEQEKKVEKVEEKPIEAKPEPKTEPVKKEEDKPVANTEEPKTVMAGLGGYVWVKWLAIVLAIIILLLLLMRFLVPPNIPNNPFGNNGGPNTNIINPLGGNGGGAGGPGGIGGGSGAGNGGGAGAQQGGSPNGSLSGNGQQGGAPGGSPSGISNGQQGGAPGGSPAGGKACKSCGGKGIDSATGKPCSSCGGSGNTAGSGAGNGASDGSGNGADSGNDGKGTNAGGQGSGSDDKAGALGGNSQQGGVPSGVPSDKEEGGDGEKPATEPTKPESTKQGEDGKTATEPKKADSSKQDEDKKGINLEDTCPICHRKFKEHSPEDLKNCILASQNEKAEMQKRLEKLKSVTDQYNEAVKEFNSGEE